VKGLWLSYGTVYLYDLLKIGDEGINAGGGEATIWGNNDPRMPGAITSMGRTLYLYSK